MGLWRAKQGLSKIWDLKTKIGLILGRRTNRMGEENGRREEEEEEEGGAKIKQAKVWNFGFLVWKLTLIMNSMSFGMDLWVCMMIVLLKPRVLLGFNLIPKIMESKVGKTLNTTRRS